MNEERKKFTACVAKYLAAYTELIAARTGMAAAERKYAESSRNVKAREKELGGFVGNNLRKVVAQVDGCIVLVQHVSANSNPAISIFDAFDGREID